MKRFLPLSVTSEGKTLTRTIVVVADDGSVSLEPFIRETASTIFVSTHLLLIDGRLFVNNGDGTTSSPVPFEF